MQHANLKAALVPGLPHLLAPEVNQGYAALAKAMGDLGDRFAAAGVERIVYYSTQWLSVLGQSFQARENLVGEHVDENWHDLPDLPFAFKIDRAFAERMASEAQSAGFQSKLVDYEGFPVDTATIVADKLLNKGRFATNIVSCWVYCDNDGTEKLGESIRRALETDGRPTAVVGVTLLSGRYFTTEIDLREDQIRDPEDDRFNRKMLGLMEKGDYDAVFAALPEYVKACKVDMGFKALSFLKGVGAAAAPRKAEVLAYAPIYGTGAAVVEL